jgi:tRNA pseudouridine55 synthase
MDGILLVDKPTGWTSHDVVAKVRGILREAQKSSLATSYPLPATPSPKVKVGHTGTLDPMATGLLILVLGKYTKRAGEFSKLDKTYEAELTLGATSSTGDREGEISRRETVDRRPNKEQIEAVLKQLTGRIQQTPPIYSAIKVDGQRAYKLARKGQEVKLEPREVTVYSLRSTAYQYPKLKIIAEVSSGTYIRTLAEDIGRELGTGAYLSALRRTRVGDFKVSDSLKAPEAGRFEDKILIW